jgi:hypothetical protein
VADPPLLPEIRRRSSEEQIYQLSIQQVRTKIEHTFPSSHMSSVTHHDPVLVNTIFDTTCPHNGKNIPPCPSYSSLSARLLMCLSFLGLNFQGSPVQDRRFNDLVVLAPRRGFSEEAHSASSFDLLSLGNRALLGLDTLMKILVNDYFPYQKDTIDMPLIKWPRIKYLDCC